MDRLHTCIILLVLLCSPCSSAGTGFLTHLETQCLEDCKPDGGEYKCKTIDKDGRSQTMYCSPQENMDYLGRQCKADSACGKHGEDFYWCRISIFSWGYCGLVKDNKIIESGKGTIITPLHRNKRNREVIDSVVDQGNRKTTTFYAEPASKDITDGNKWKNEVKDLLNRWNNGLLRGKSTSELLKSANLRIDLQGIINNTHYNLQIQINKSRGNNESTTISQIIVPAGIQDRYMRRAFWESFVRRARVFVEVTKN